MLTHVFLVAVGMAVVIAWKRWRTGVLWAIVIGMLQDPVRKLTPGTPAIMAISSLPVWLAVLLRMRAMDPTAWRRFARDWPRVARHMMIFVWLLLPAALVALQYGLGAWRLVVIGLLGYAAPLLGVLMGFSYVQRPTQLAALISWYCLITSAFMLGSLAEYTGLLSGWAAVGTESLGMRWVRYAGGGVFDLISGFFRSPDVMGWHAAALVMLSLTLVLARAGHGGQRWLAVAVLGAICVVIAGRRKMLVMPFVWVTVVAFLHIRAGRVSRFLMVSAVAALTVIGLYVAGSEIEIGQDYYAYAGSVRDDAYRRVFSGAWEDLTWTLAQSGVLGKGLGSASQGAQHVAGVHPGSWQESGLSKLMVELGLLGFLSALALGLALARSLMRCLSLTGPGEGSLLGGAIGFCAANAAGFVVSHQVYGDLVIVTLTAFFVGVVLGSHRWLGAGSR